MNSHAFGQALAIDSLHKTYPGAEHPVFAGYSLALDAGSLCALIGVSGVGKTTLLNCIAALDTWDSGTITLGGTPVPKDSPMEGALYRRQKVGMAFQSSYLLPEFTLLENIQMPLMTDGSLGIIEAEWCRQLVSLVNLEALTERLPSQLSGGQAARAGLARALARKPAMWLLDEPTGNLDPETALEVFHVLQALHSELRPTTIIVTHNPALAEKCQRVEKL